MPAGASADPQFQAMGTCGNAATTAGRMDRTLPLAFLLARLPKVTWMAPSFTSSAATWFPMILSGGGNPASLLLAGMRLWVR